MAVSHSAVRTRHLLTLLLALIVISAAPLTAQPIPLPPGADAISQSRAFSSIQKLTEPTPAEDNRYGLQLELDGSTLAVSSVHILSENDPGPDPNEYVGSVYLYTTGINGQWSLQASLQTPDTHKADAFGGSLGLDGDWLVVGAPGKPDISGDLYHGKAHIYKRTGSTWTLTQTLIPDPGVIVPSGFGTSVAIDGTRMLVGAPGESLATGAVYVYDWNGTTWMRTDKLTGPSAFGAFGFSVAMDGHTALIGATLIDGVPGADNKPGEAYVYSHNGLGWTQQQLLPTDAANGNRFGFSVALEGNTALVGAYKDDSSKGAVHVFTQSGGSLWTEEAKLVPAETAAGDRVGWSVDLEGDIAVLGADGRDEAPYNDLGTVYIFKRTGTTWTQIQKLLPPELAGDSEFGGAVDIEGDVLIVGAPDRNNDEGAVFSFKDEQPVTPTPDTPTPDTPTPDTPTPDTPTPETSTPEPQLPLLKNGGFEEADPADDKQALHWKIKNMTGDKRKCKPEKAHGNNCFYQFKGGAGEKAKLIQQVDPSSYASAGSYQMYATGFYFAKGGASAKIKVVATQADTTKEKLVMTVGDVARVWQPFGGQKTLSGAPVKIKYMIVNKSPSGKIRFDDLALCNCCCPSPLRLDLIDPVALKPLP